MTQFMLFEQKCEMFTQQFSFVVSLEATLYGNNK